MRTSENIDLLAAALSKAQGEFPSIKTSATNTQFNSAYADIDDVLISCRPTLTKNDLCLIQPLSNDDKGLVVTTRLIHKSGQWIEESLSVKPDKPTIQGLGSAATYGRRYGAVSMLGLATGDDDGEAAMNRPEPKPQSNQNQIKNVTPPAGIQQQQPKIPKPNIDYLLKVFAPFAIDRRILEDYFRKPLEEFTAVDERAARALNNEFNEGKKDKEGLLLSLELRNL